MNEWLRKILTWLAVILLLWAAWGVWLDYRETERFEARRALSVALAQWQAIPGLVQDLAKLFTDRARETAPEAGDGNILPRPTDTPVPKPILPPPSGIVIARSTPTMQNLSSPTATPLERLRELRQRKATPVPTATPQPTPTTTRPPADAGICYRPPELQRWVAMHTGIRSCRLITEPELERITIMQLYETDLLKPGDLAGFANVQSAIIPGYCGDWTDSDYVAAVLDGLNPDASLLIHVDIPHTAVVANLPIIDAGPRDEIIKAGIAGQWPTALRIGQHQRWSDTTIKRLFWRGGELKRQMNAKVLAVAEAVTKARDGKPGLIRLERIGNARSINWGEPGSVSVGVVVRWQRWQPRTEMPECKE